MIFAKPCGSKSGLTTNTAVFLLYEFVKSEKYAINYLSNLKLDVCRLEVRYFVNIHGLGAVLLTSPRNSCKNNGRLFFLKLLVLKRYKRRTMNSKLLFRKVLTMCLTVTLLATFSMAALAGERRASGEIVVTGISETAVVTVNGEAVKSGRTIFSSSTIATTEGTGAVVNLGQVGRIQIASNTTFTLSFENGVISGDLAQGSITVLNAANSVSVKTSSGEVVLNSGETATADSGSAAKQSTSATSSNNWLVYALIFGGAVTGIVLATSQDTENRFGSAAPVSPVS